ncbi:MAG TPA: hypothetical protein VL866_09095 [Pyrinomonadaceae bacterium]|nr:hypothetical protein [Pyrinomonadaceae bacterium]
MNRNQKIALGCGGAGCLGLIVVIIAGSVIWYLSRTPGLTRNSNFNVNINRNSNTSVAADDSDSNSNSNSSSTATATRMSEDDKHKLYYAATATKDTNTMVRVWKRLGLTDADGTPNEAYREFAKDHIGWLFRNTEFMQEVNSEEKARAYVDAHIND